MVVCMLCVIIECILEGVDRKCILEGVDREYIRGGG